MNNQNEDQKDEAITEVLDFTKPDFSFIPNGSHAYTQRGPYLICKSCDLEHATFIGMDQIMVGLREDGTPLLKPR